jgi:hypothetical protein
MLSNRNQFVIASAGSRKTTLLVERALAITGKRVLLTTYTNENVGQINAYLVARNGSVPKNIFVVPWYTFLLQEGVRPYQNHMTQLARVRSITFEDPPPKAQFAKKTNVDRYFFTNGRDIYGDKVADFVCECDEASQGLVVKRLEKIFAHVLIDELQDFAGYDFDLVGKLLRSSISITAACDPRQATFSTNKSPRNKQFKGERIIKWIEQQRRAGLLSVEDRTDCHRSNQIICDFADSLFPDYPKSVSKNTEITGHDGLFLVPDEQVTHYVRKFNPKILRYSVTTPTMNLPACNIGVSKGRTYDRVLVFPTKKMVDYLKTGDTSKAGHLAKLYVAATRARYSLAFVVQRADFSPPPNFQLWRAES